MGRPRHNLFNQQFAQSADAIVFPLNLTKCFVPALISPVNLFKDKVAFGYLDRSRVKLKLKSRLTGQYAWFSVIRGDCLWEGGMSRQFSD